MSFSVSLFMDCELDFNSEYSIEIITYNENKNDPSDNDINLNICDQNTGIRHLSISLPDLIRAIITAGYPEKSCAWQRKLRLLKIPYLLYFFSAENRYLRLKNEIDSLEKSEKGTISYDLGMIFAHLLSERLLDISHTIHLSIARSHFDIEIARPANSNRLKEPDLIACNITDNNQLSDINLIEAKGTISKCNDNYINNGISQLRNVASVNNNIDLGKYLSYFNGLKNNNLTIYWIDPDTEGKIKIKNLKAQYIIFSHYYKFFKMLLDYNTDQSGKMTIEKWKDFNFKGIPINDCLSENQLFIGIEEKIYKILENTFKPDDNSEKNNTSKNNKNKNFDSSLKKLTENLRTFTETSDKIKSFKKNVEIPKNISIGNDGIIIMLKKK